MKNLIIYFILTLSVLFSSCDDWLSVSPRTESITEEMFSSQLGFRDALTGAYLELMDDKSYGEYLTMSKIEFLVSFWNYGPQSGEYALAHHDYKHLGAETIIDDIYGQQYKAILAVNSILEYIDQKKSILSVGVYEALKGESLAIRAMCHLDILRLFGPVPSMADNSSILPYVKTVTKDIHPHISFEAYKNEIISDFNEAKDLLKTHLDLQDEITDDYFKYRKIRMNYHAVRGLQARAYLWFGDKESAYEAAMEVIEATDRPGGALRLGTASDFAEKDYALTSEQILSLYRYDMYSKYNHVFREGILFRGKNSNYINEDIFKNTGVDIRELNLWNLLITPRQSQHYVTNKYRVTEFVSGSTPDYKFIPLLRLSELYLIAIEAGPEEKAQQLWTDFIFSRNLEFAPLPMDDIERERAIVAEYRKEFYAEGCVFYLYKRLNLAKEDFLWAPPELEINYVLPLPVTEIVNN